MEEIITLDSMKQVKAISNPIRYQMVNLLIENAMTGSQIARALDIPRQRAHYHLKNLQEAGIIKLEEEKINKGMLEKYYRTVAKSILIDANFGDEHISSKARKIQNRHYKEIKNIMLRQAETDLNQPDIDERIGSLKSSRQYTVFLSPEQEHEASQKLIDVLEYYFNLSDKNLETQKEEDLLAIRYTLLITPPYLPENKQEPED